MGFLRLKLLPMNQTDPVSRAHVNAIAKHISERLTTKKSCIVFEGELSQAWPLKLKSKEAKRLTKAIQAFAKERGWSATISDPGIRVTFKKLNHD